MTSSLWPSMVRPDILHVLQVLHPFWDNFDFRKFLLMLWTSGVPICITAYRTGDMKTTQANRNCVYSFAKVLPYQFGRILCGILQNLSVQFLGNIHLIQHFQWLRIQLSTSQPNLIPSIRSVFSRSNDTTSCAWLSFSEHSVGWQSLSLMFCPRTEYSQFSFSLAIFPSQQDLIPDSAFSQFSSQPSVHSD